MKNLLTILLTLFCVTCFSQAPCSEDSLKTLNKELKKSNKGPFSKRVVKRADVYFKMGLCSLSETDTTYMEWFYKAMNTYKKEYIYDEYARTKRRYKMYQIGLCYYYLKEYKKSLIYLRKTITSDYRNSLKYYYAGKCLIELQEYGEAIIQLEQFKQKAKDNIDASQLIEICNKKLK